MLLTIGELFWRRIFGDEHELGGGFAFFRDGEQAEGFDVAATESLVPSGEPGEFVVAAGFFDHAGFDFGGVDGPEALGVGGDGGDEDQQCCPQFEGVHERQDAGQRDR